MGIFRLAADVAAKAAKTVLDQLSPAAPAPPAALIAWQREWSDSAFKHTVAQAIELVCAVALELSALSDDLYSLDGDIVCQRVEAIEHDLYEIRRHLESAVYGNIAANLAHKSLVRSCVGFMFEVEAGVQQICRPCEHGGVFTDASAFENVAERLSAVLDQLQLARFGLEFGNRLSVPALPASGWAA